MLLKTRWQLRRVTGDAAIVHGETDLKVKIRATAFTHLVLVVNIEENIILGIYIINAHGRLLDMKELTFRIRTHPVPREDLFA